MKSIRRAFEATAMLALVGLAMASRAEQPTPAEQGSVTDDWMQVEGVKSKVFLPGMWAYAVERSPEGVLVTVHGGQGKSLLRVQSIEGKTEATPEKLQKIFEENIVPGAQRTDEKGDNGLRARYAVKIEGQDAVFKALFARHGTTSYMVYMQSLADDVKADPGLEKLMDSVLGSFQPL
jgi:hypothetical protein